MKVDIREAKLLTNALVRTLIKLETPLTKSAIQELLELQDSVLNLRNLAIYHQREQGHTLIEVAELFELSPSRISQIHRGVRMNKTRRLAASRK